MTENSILLVDWECRRCRKNNCAGNVLCFYCNNPPLSLEQSLNHVEAFPPLPAVSTNPVVKSEPSPPEKVPELYLTVDIERKGKQFHHGIMAIGACLGDAEGTILEQKAFCSKVPPKDEFEKRTWDEFWSKHPDVLARIDAAAVPDALSEFQIWLFGIEKKYGPFGRKHRDKVKFRLVSDNPAYDIGHINLELFKTEIEEAVGAVIDAVREDPELSEDKLDKLIETGVSKIGTGSTMAEMFDDYVPTDDPSEQIAHMTPLQQQLVEKHVTAPHDHWPVNDATQIYQQRVGIKRVADATTITPVKKGRTITFTEDCEVVYVERSKLIK